MILALDSYYKNDICNTSLVVFDDMTSDTTIYTDTIYTNVTSEYIPGEFYKRELPGISKILGKLKNEHPDIWNKIDIIIVDSFIMLKSGHIEWGGLGFYLYEFLKSIGETKTIYGVAKSKFGDCDSISEKVFRGKSLNPLYVQSSSNDNIIAAYMIKSMHGKYRIPTMLKLVDNLSRIFI